MHLTNFRFYSLIKHLLNKPTKVLHSRSTGSGLGYGVFLLGVILISFAQCHVKVKIQTKSTCKEYLNGISEMWKMDSIGLMGSRNDFYLVILEKCNLVGLNWSEIEPFFGKANKEGSLFSCYSYRYYSKIDSIYKTPVREFIEIDVDNDKRKIIRFKRGYNDFFILK